MLRLHRHTQHKTRHNPSPTEQEPRPDVDKDTTTRTTTVTALDTDRDTTTYTTIRRPGELKPRHPLFSCPGRFVYPKANIETTRTAVLYDEDNIMSYEDTPAAARVNVLWLRT